MPLRRNTQPQKRVISPIFPIPEGLGDLEFAENDIDEDIWFDPDSDDDDDERGPGKKKKKKKKKRRRRRRRRNRRRRRQRRRNRRNRGKNRDNRPGKGGKKRPKDRDEDRGKRDGPNTPDSFEVIKQVIRTKKDGSQVVDLTVEVDRVLKADKYEFRITKKDTGKTTIQSDQ